MTTKIIKLLQQNRSTIKKLLTHKKNFTWNNLVKPLENINDKLFQEWSIISNLNAVVGSPESRKAYETCLPHITQYTTELSQNTKLYNAIKSIAASKEFLHFDNAQKKIIHDDLRDFHLAGVALPEKQKKEFLQLEKKLAELQNKFANNVLDATQNWSVCLTQQETQGIPATALATAQKMAQLKHKKGWLFSLDFPSYQAVITYADSRKLRKKIYKAYVTRACGGKFDNSRIMQEILITRLKLAKLVNFKNYTEYSQKKKMAKTSQEVADFLNNLAQHSFKAAKKEFTALKQFAPNLEPWDLPYYSEKLYQKKFAISQEELRPYFPDQHVLTGLFAIVKKLYGITIKEKKGVAAWHPDVRFFEFFDTKKQLLGKLYVDLYAREGKRGGAWMDEGKVRRILPNSNVQIPVAYLICNFSQPVGNDPSLLTHQEVTTLFHELGHCLQHLLTKVDYAAAAGIHGVPWDAVELPSQFMENWCFTRAGLKLISKHYQSGKSLPKKYLDKIIAGKNYNAAMQMLRQIEFALFDLRLHSEFDPKVPNQIQKILNEVRAKTSVIPVVKFNKMQNSFAHIFAGGYAAGYYSYKWAEVLSADAFSKFEQKGIFDHKTGHEFLHCILESGGSADPMELFIKFRGRKPKIDALLKHSGIIKQ